MHLRFLIMGIIFSLSAAAQQERDTTLNNCPVFITDSVSSNNFFMEQQPSIIKVYRSKGNLTITVEQRDQFFTLLFNGKRLANKKYKIGVNTRSETGVIAKYSFRLGQQVSYVNVTGGSVEASFDKKTKYWNIKVAGLLSNYVGQTVTYFKVKADFFIP